MSLIIVMLSMPTDMKSGRAVGALIGGDDLVDRLAQPALVEMPGQLVVIRQLFEPALLRLAVADRADDAEHDPRPARALALRPAALMHPDEDAARRRAAGTRSRTDPRRRNAPASASWRCTRSSGWMRLAKLPPGRRLGRRIPAQARRRRAGPVEPVAVEVPGIGDIAGRFEGGGSDGSTALRRLADIRPRPALINATGSPEPRHRDKIVRQL